MTIILVEQDPEILAAFCDPSPSRGMQKQEPVMIEDVWYSYEDGTKAGIAPTMDDRA